MDGETEGCHFCSPVWQLMVLNTVPGLPLGRLGARLAAAPAPEVDGGPVGDVEE